LASHCPSDEREDYTFRTLSLRPALGGQICGAGIRDINVKLKL
jgi:hypothetical protein